MQVPESVRAYLYDGSIRRAVNELLSLEDGQILEGLGWNELAQFYRAQLAARQLEAEWAIFALGAWEQVWQDLSDRWSPLSPDDQHLGSYESNLDLASLREEKDHSLWFIRAWIRNDHVFYGALCGVPSIGLRLKFACELADGDNVDFGEITTVRDGYDNYFPLDAIPLDGSEVEPVPLRDIARHAIAVAERHAH